MSESKKIDLPVRGARIRKSPSHSDVKGVLTDQYMTLGQVINAMADSHDFNPASPGTPFYLMVEQLLNGYCKVMVKLGSDIAQDDPYAPEQSQIKPGILYYRRLQEGENHSPHWKALERSRGRTKACLDDSLSPSPWSRMRSATSSIASRSPQ